MLTCWHQHLLKQLLGVVWKHVKTILKGIQPSSISGSQGSCLGWWYSTATYNNNNTVLLHFTDGQADYSTSLMRLGKNFTMIYHSLQN